MMALKPPVVAGIVLSVAAAVALALQSVSDIMVRQRLPGAFASAAGATATAAGPDRPAFALRMVDTGGVGMPLSDGAVADHSHARRVFHDVIRKDAPYVDAAAFSRVDTEWRTYVDQMIAYGNNAMAVPMLLELIDFDRTAAPPAAAVYEPGSPYPARHAVVRQQFAPLFDWTEQRGMHVFLETDMLALTPPLLRHLRGVAPAASAVGIDTADPAVWATYRAGLEELFDKMPSIAGLVIRVGEGGSLYNVDDWPYQSEPGVRSVKSVRAMLHGLLPLFEARHKTLVLRSWTVGVGGLGRLHVDPRVYDAVLGDIESPALIVSTKFTAGDFFSYLPLNPTLARGRHPRLIEFQARPEFEGFGAFPDFLGAEYARALRTLRAANPHVAGTFVFSQFGGPRRNGRRTLYPFHGFWLWTDANVYVASKLALDPNADVDHLARQWARMRFGDDARVADVVAGVLNRTRHAVLTGFYIRPFAEREVRVPGLELPPLMWIFEWDMVGGWHSLLSIVYRAARDDVEVAIAEGHAAAADVRAARQDLQAAFATAPPGTCARFCDEALRSLEYQETLFDALAAWRQTFLGYYRWLDTGDARAWGEWRTGRARFETAAAHHVARFGRDLDFPAFDLSSATRADTFANRGGRIRLLASAVLIVVIGFVIAGSPRVQRLGVMTRVAVLSTLGRVGHLMWTAVIAPWRLAHQSVDAGSAIAVTIIMLTMVTLLVGCLTSFATPTMAVASSVPLIAFALAFESSATGVTWRDGRGRLLVASVGPIVPAVIVVFAMVAYLGPVAFWYGFWISRSFRLVLLAIAIATVLWTAYVMIVAGSRDGGRQGRVGGVLAAVGAGLVAWTVLMPDWIDVLRYLDHPLNLAPATETMLFALSTYVGVRLGVGKWSLIVGGLLLVVGWTLWLRSVSRLRGKAIVPSE